MSSSGYNVPWLGRYLHTDIFHKKNQDPSFILNASVLKGYDENLVPCPCETKNMQQKFLAIDNVWDGFK